MKQKKIRLTTINDAMEFVKRASRCDFDIDVFYNRVVIDAKSLLGILVLGLNQEVNLSIYADECSQLCQDIEKYITA